jgi:hypothetical protein
LSSYEGLGKQTDELKAKWKAKEDGLKKKIAEVIKIY